jgi:hypothetical protein
MIQPMRIPLLLTVLLLAPPTQATPALASPTPRVLPADQSLAKVADNPCFLRGLQAATQGLGTFSVILDAAPVDSLSERINLCHLGLGAAGWTAAGQSSIDVNGSTTQVLLTYRRPVDGR